MYNAKCNNLTRMTQDKFDNYISGRQYIKIQKDQKNLEGYTDKTTTCNQVTEIEQIFNINIQKSLLPSSLLDSESCS